MIACMNHGSGTFNARYDALGQVVNWAENGKAPPTAGSFTAVDEGQTGATRPMCLFGTYLHDQFCNTHVLRRSTATRLQRANVSMKEIADLLRHRSLDTARVYARVDIERLREVALTWRGSTS